MTKKLSKTILNLVLFVSLFSIIIMKVFDLSFEYNEYQNNKKLIKEKFLQQEKKNLKLEVTKAISLINYNYKIQEKVINKNLKLRANKGYNIAINLYNKYKDEKSNKQIIDIIKNSFRGITFNDGYGYYSLFDFSGKTIFHGINKKYEDNYTILKSERKKGDSSFEKILEFIKKKKQSFYEWKFFSPISKKIEDKKGYIKVIEPLNLIIVTADYKSRIKKQLQEDVLDRIKNMSYFKNSYVFVMNKNGVILSNRYRQDYEGKNYKNIKLKEEREVFNNILNSVKNKNDAFIFYKWKAQGDHKATDKLTYVKKYDNWQWIISSGVQLDKMYSLIEEEKNKLEDEAWHKLYYSIAIFIILLIFIIFTTRKIFRDLDNSFEVFVEFFKSANKNSKTIDTKKVNFYEFKELSKQANKMIKTKIENEKEIKTKNKEVLINLSLLNEYKKAVDVSAIVSKTDSKGIITFANEKFCKISGYSRKELLGAKHNLVKHPDTKENIYKELWKTILSKKVWKGVLKNRAKDGSAYYVKSTIVPIVDVNGEINEFIAIRYDITDLINKERRIKLQTTDALTGLPNRQKLLEDLHFDDNLILAIFNIQRFRQINEFYGFEIGDKFLIEVSKKLNELVLKEKLSFYKLQGDEYAILSSNKECTLDYFKTICKKIVSIVKEYSFEIENYTLNADFCIGISSEKNYFINAEMAKNHAKLENKEIIVFDENREIKNNLIENINWTKKLKSAIENDRIVVFKQPIISNKNNKIEKYECLVRLMDEEGTIFSPFYFLHVAKKAKLYNRLTQIIIKKSFSYFSDKDVEFSVNLTIEDILNKQTVELIEQSLNKYKTISQRVIFEIVEEEGIENYDEISFFIEKMKSYGCKIAIDDFGTGYSNFEYLMKLNVDIIKIDGSMIKYINQDLNAKIVTELIVTFSKKLKIKTVAEYVHSKEVYEIIKNMGIDYSQGFYFGKPESID